MNLVLLGVLLYVVAQLLIGVAVSRRIHSEEDYLLAGRRFGYWMASFSFFATWFGAETCIGAAGRMYDEGLSGGSADPFGYAGCLFLMGAVLAAPLYRRGLVTLADLYRQRYSPLVERCAVLLMIPTSLLWAAAQIRGFGQVLDVSSGMGTFWAITLAAAVAIIYTGFGGMQADVITDFIQGLAIILGLVVLLFMMFPGVREFTDACRAVEPVRWNPFGGGLSLIETVDAWMVPVFGSVVAQELVARGLSARSPQVASRSAMMGGGLYLVVGCIPALLGLVGAGLLPGLEHGEQILPRLAREHLPTLLYILFAGALVSAILSTVDSVLLACASLTTHNVIIPLCRNLDERGKLRLSRWGVMGFGVLAWGLALQADSIFELVENASSFGSAGLVVILFLGLFTRFGGPRAALASLAVGVVTWMGASHVELPGAYLLSLAGALLAYAVTGLLFFRKEHVRS